jgi:hypothetical protein
VATGANTPSEDDADFRLWLGDTSDRGQVSPARARICTLRP